jgi:hypothetical protein
VQIEEPKEFRCRVGAVVDAQVDGAVASTPVTAAGAHDQEGGRLTSAPIATGGVARRKGGEKPRCEITRCSFERRFHLIDDLRAGEDVPLTTEPFPGNSPCPVEALHSGVGSGASHGINDTHLPLVALLIRRRQRVHDGVPGLARSQHGEPFQPIGEVGQSLRGDGPGPGSSPRHGGADGEKLGGDGDAPLGPGARASIAGDDREGQDRGFCLQLGPQSDLRYKQKAARLRTGLGVSSPVEGIAFLDRIPAGREVNRCDLPKGGHLANAVFRQSVRRAPDLARLWAAGMERASRRRVDRRRDIAFKDDALRQIGVRRMALGNRG